MKYLIACLLLSFSILGLAQSNKQVLMRKELTKVNTYYQQFYVQNPQINHLFKKIDEYRSNPAKGLNEYASPDEIDGLNAFEVLQTKREEISMTIFAEYQSTDYVEMMRQYNHNRKILRLQLAHREITWRMFVDELQSLIQKNQAQEKTFWEDTNQVFTASSDLHKTCIPERPYQKEYLGYCAVS